MIDLVHCNEATSCVILQFCNIYIGFKGIIEILIDPQVKLIVYWTGMDTSQFKPLNSRKRFPASQNNSNNFFRFGDIVCEGCVYICVYIYIYICYLHIMCSLHIQLMCHIVKKHSINSIAYNVKLGGRCTYILVHIF